MQKTQDTAPATNARTLDMGRRNLLRGGLAGLAGTPFLASSLASSTAAKPIGPGLLEPGAVSAGPVADQPGDMEQLFRQIKREASPEQLYRFLYAMPKGGDIHHHLGGGFLPRMWLAIGTDAKRNGGQQIGRASCRERV